MTYISELTIDHLQRYNCQIPELYTDLLQQATEIHPPPHGKGWYGKAYRQAARNADWFADSLVVNAYEEGNGSRQVWEFAGQVDRPEIAELIRQHSIDESRHSAMFATLLDLLFPTKLEAATRAQVKSFCPGYNPGDLKSIATAAVRISGRETIDQLIQVNLLEIRALILQLLLRPVLLAYAEPQDLAQVTSMCDRFIFDETQHIAYSAYCIGNYGTWGDSPDRDWLRDRVIYRQSTINEMFLQESDLDANGGIAMMLSPKITPDSSYLASRD